MADWLFKEEPDHYSFADLERDGSTLWDGVTNNLARKNLRQVKKGDRILFYHTGIERAIVGEMEAAASAQEDASSGDAKAVVVKVKPVRRWPHPVTLERIKQTPELAGWDLVRLPRLSVMAVTAEQWKKVEQLSRMAE